MNLKSFSKKGYKIIEEGNIEIGDVVVVKNRLGGVSIYEIDGVTKTMAKSKGERYTTRFRLDAGKVRYLPEDIWDSNQYFVYRKESSE